ncbi:MAG: hypothetical protein FWK04_15085 [Nostoc sp. GBBB01]|uniref:Uncharacterized protein n=1 Tax=Nostoc punctiforme FACHB-252 TaxID=1357509 RepID=A0ABR8H2M7_NOSPU|nr:hypothetical protein [Nostoc punctiforme]MBD2609729.1 hypothetical protein [Nostoc punctiforme FACHB-252]MBL1200378.1 hypothetical protein [Nostoc sp. GBBB01]
MAVVSTFELLLKPQLPKRLTDTVPELSSLARKIVQGYFLSISNITSDFLYLSVVFTAKTPGLDLTKIASFLDTTGQNDPVSRVFTEDDKKTTKTRFTIPLNAYDTGLLIVQPNIADLAILKAANFELRGYVEIFLSSGSTPQSTQLLITPEHRGTFFGEDSSKLGEVAYALPTATGKSLFELTKGV